MIRIAAAGLAALMISEGAMASPTSSGGILDADLSTKPTQTTPGPSEEDILAVEMFRLALEGKEAEAMAIHAKLKERFGWHDPGENRRMILERTKPNHYQPPSNPTLRYKYPWE